MTSTTVKAVVLMLGFVFAGLFLKACENNPASSTDSEHAPAIGFQLLLGDDVLVEYFQREYLFDPEGNFPEFVHNGEALLLSSENISGDMLRDVRVRWMDRDRVVFDLAEFGEESGGTAGGPGDYELRFEYLLPDGSRDVQPENERPLEFIYDRDSSTWTFDISLIQSGGSEVRINLFHLDHDDLRSVPMPVVVEM
ncbi:MAG: hypothetical protein LAT84_06455 [Balneolia bacterium]|nr:hypothetical protein [Balneolia bacterium]